LAGVGAGIGMIAIVLGLLLAAGVVVLVALPFLREPETADDRLDAPTEAQARRLSLVEERDRALAALKELEFDHRSGAIDDEDYRTLIGPLRQAAAAALRAIDLEAGVLAEQEDVQSDDDHRDDPGSDGREPAIDERAHQFAVGGEDDERDQRERDPERQHDL